MDRQRPLIYISYILLEPGPNTITKIMCEEYTVQG